MRDRNRIEPFCERLKDAWQKMPDLRFGQLMFCFFAKECDSDPFYIEDEELISKFEKYIQENGGK